MAGFDLNSLLNAKSKNTIRSQATQTEQAEGFKVVMLDVEDLMPSKDNFYSTENIDELALSIELVGHIEQNLVVKPEAHGKYEVIAGHRRRLAALKLLSQGKEEYRQVPCLIKKETDTIKDTGNEQDFKQRNPGRQGRRPRRGIEQHHHERNGIPVAGGPGILGKTLACPLPYRRTGMGQCLQGGRKGIQPFPARIRQGHGLHPRKRD